MRGAGADVTVAAQGLFSAFFRLELCGCLLSGVIKMASNFKYACTIYGHDADVRNIVSSPLPSSHILSASRDKTARLWAKDSDGKGYHQDQCFEGHTKFVSSVVAVAPTEDYPEGLVFTGSSDKIIRIFLPSKATSIAELKGHTDTVCSLVVGQYQMLISGSWDKTARAWIYKKGVDGAVEGKQVLNLEGHVAAVWSVLLLQQGLVATGSADKTIKLWKAGKCEQTLKGHEDCVRDLAMLSACQFLSCANDATVRRWTTTGECVQVYYGHTNYIYSMSVLPDSIGFVTTGEDRTFKVWNIEKSDATQTLTLPAQSGWNIAVLENGDLAVALSDSTIRIFTQDLGRAASDADAIAYETEVTASLNTPGGNEEVVDEKDVKPFDALESAGSKDGQVIMVRNGTVIEAHQWSGNDMKWTKIGDVVSSSNKKSANKKTEYNGREYDFVFDVDIQEGAPPLKLPYNLSDDPWFAAQKFIDDNDMSQYFLDEICTFIMDNTKEARKNQASKPQSSSSSMPDPFTGSSRYTPSEHNIRSNGVQDPFTGGGRYVPGTDQSSTVNTGQDPFTGGGRYMPGSGDNEIQFGGGAASDPMMNPNRYIPDENDPMDTSLPPQTPDLLRKPVSTTATTTYFPKEGYIFFAAANVDAILGKLKTFSSECGGLSELEIENLKTLVQPSGIGENCGIDTLWKVLHWSPEYLLPALDILRLTCLLHESSCKQLCCGTSETDAKPKRFLQMLCQHVICHGNSKPANANRLLSLRTLCNMFKYPDGSAFMMAGYKDILQALSAGFSLGMKEGDNSSPFFGNKNVQIAAASVLLNFAVLLTSSQHVSLSPLIQELSSVVRSSCVEVTIVHLVTGEKLSESEATFRYLVCLGTLISHDANDTWLKEARALGAEKVVETAGALFSNVPKIYECTKCLSAVLFE